MEDKRREFKLPGEGLVCQSCGHILDRVYRTLRSAGFVMRERICPHCKAINTTSERVLNARRSKQRFSDTCE